MGKLVFMKTRKAYPTDPNDAEWKIIMPYFPPASREGRPRVHPYREIVCAIFYFLKTGCQWEMLPQEFPHWKTLYHYYRLWCWNGLWQRIYDELHQKVRVKEGREPQPSAGIIDSQSVKTTEAGGVRGYDAGKKVNGRKRHLLVDTLGFPIVVKVQAANVQDRDGAVEVLAVPANFRQENKYSSRSTLSALNSYFTLPPY